MIMNYRVINDKNKAENEFRKLKQKVTNNRLKQDLIKDFERYLFGEDIENIEPEEKYEKSIAEKVKTNRRKRNSDDNEIDYAAARDFINWQDQQREGLKILTKQQMFSRLPILLAQIQAGNNSRKA